MKITSYSSMGYIYLMPDDESTEWESTTNIYVFKDSGVNIPVYKDSKLSNKLDNLRIVDKILWTAVDDNDFILKYPCDRSGGYVYGIELELPATKLIRFIRDKVYRIYQIDWLNKDFTVVLLDREKKVFSESSLIYPLTEDNDVFIIVSKEDDNYSSVSAIITSNEDIYPFEYLATPQFLV